MFSRVLKLFKTPKKEKKQNINTDDYEDDEKPKFNVFIRIKIVIHKKLLFPIRDRFFSNKLDEYEEHCLILRSIERGQAALERFKESRRPKPIESEGKKKQEEKPQIIEPKLLENGKDFLEFETEQGISRINFVKGYVPEQRPSQETKTLSQPLPPHPPQPTRVRSFYSKTINFPLEALKKAEFDRIVPVFEDLVRSNEPPLCMVIACA